MCEQVAAIAHAEVVSVYVREQESGAPCSCCAPTWAFRAKWWATSSSSWARASPASRPSACGPCPPRSPSKTALQARAGAGRGALPHLPLDAAGDRRAQADGRARTCSAGRAATSRRPRSRCRRRWPRPSRSRSIAPPIVRRPAAEQRTRALGAPDRHRHRHAASGGQGAGRAHVPRARSSPPVRVPRHASWWKAPSRGSATRSSAPGAARPGALARSPARAGRPAGHPAGPALAVAARQHLRRARRGRRPAQGRARLRGGALHDRRRAARWIPG